MRILTVTNLYPTSADPTFGTFVDDQVQALRSHPRVQACEVLFFDGRKEKWNYARALRDLHRILRRDEFDVILAHYGLAGLIAVTQRNVPVVVTYHAGDVLGASWQLIASRLAYRLATDAISVSAAGLDVLPGPAHHLTCGIDLELFAPRDRTQARRRFDVPEDALAILFPSAPHRVVKMYPRFVAVRDELRRRGRTVHELQLKDLARADVPEIMAAADVMVLTSTLEATPVAIMEALACGLSVVATPVAEIPTMLADARSARVLPFDVSTFADAVEELAACAAPPREADPASRRYDENELTERLVAILEDAGARSGPSLHQASSTPR